MKIKPQEINEVESTLDNCLHEISQILSPEKRDYILTEYYEFQKKLHQTIREEFPNEQFKNIN
jgi:hypothetical protein